MADKKLQIVITAVDNASKVLNNIGKSAQSMNKGITNAGKSISAAGKNISSLGRNLSVGITAPMVAAGAAVVGLAKKAGKFQSVSDSYRSMTKEIGISGDELISSVKKATSGTISNMDVMTNFLKAKTLIGKEALGEGGKNFERFALIAKKAARTTGHDVDFMFESIVTGIGRSSTKWLDNTGIVINATDAQNAYAESIGKTRSELTETEKKIATTNAFLEKAEEELKNIAPTAGGISTSFKQLSVAFEEAGISMGMTLIPAVQSLIQSITPLILEWAPKIEQFFANLINKFSELSPNMQKIILGFTLLLAALGPILIIVGAMASGFGAIVTVVGFLGTLLGTLVGFLIPALIALFTFLLSPIGLVVVAIAALIAIGILLVRNWTTIKNRLTDAFRIIAVSWNETVARVKKAINDLVASAKAKFNEMKTAIQNKINQIKQAIITAITAAKTTAVNLFNQMKTGVQNAINAAKAAVQSAVNAIKSAIASIAGVINRIIGKFRQLASAARNALSIGGGGGGGAGQHGMVVPGAFNEAVPVIAHGGERIVPKTGVNANAGTGGGGGSTVNINIAGDVSSMDMVDNIVNAVKDAIGRDNELATLGVGV